MDNLAYCTEVAKFWLRSGIELLKAVKIVGPWTMWDITLSIIIFSMSWAIFSGVFGLIHFDHKETQSKETQKKDDN